MSVQARKLRSGKVVYWVAFRFNGRVVWERSGTDKRAAEALDTKRKREVRDGTYKPGVRGRVSNQSWFAYYWTRRTNRTLDNDRALIDNHVLCLDWFARTPMEQTRPADILRVVEEMRAAGRLSAKSISIVFGVMKQAYEFARFEQKIMANPCSLPKGTIKWKTSGSKARKPYTRSEAHALIYDARISPDQRVFNALAFFTGMREGEVCGRRWRDWLRDPQPLSAIRVHSQYDDRPLKTDDGDDTRPRLVPVHPDLETILRDWWSDGFELVHLRKPTLEDFIVPHRKLGGHTKSSAYKAFRRSLDRAAVTNRSLHSTRHTFISVARSNGARKDVLERVTHNAKGEIIDTYTTFEWRPLCEAVALFDLELDQNAAAAIIQAPAPGLEAGSCDPNAHESSQNQAKGSGSGRGQKAAERPLSDAWFDASQRKLLKLTEIDPEAARPGLVVTRGVALAKRWAEGDEGAGDELRASLLEQARREVG